MLNYNQPIKEQKSYQGLQMSEMSPVMKLIIRGKKREFLSAVGKSLNMVLPTNRMAWIRRLFNIGNRPFCYNKCLWS